MFFKRFKKKSAIPLRKTIKFSEPSDDSSIALHQTINAYNTQEVMRLLQQGASTKYKDAKQNTALHIAARQLRNIKIEQETFKYPMMLGMLIAYGASPSVKNDPATREYANKEIQKIELQYQQLKTIIKLLFLFGANETLFEKNAAHKTPTDIFPQLKQILLEDEATPSLQKLAATTLAFSPIQRAFELPPQLEEYVKGLLQNK